MIKTEKIRETAEIVKEILTEEPATRDDDYLLYSYILHKYGVPTQTSFSTIIVMIRKKRLPTLETVGRARRKAQELYPELRGTRKVQQARLEQTKDFIEFSQDKRI